MQDLRRASPEEIDEIRKALKRLERALQSGRSVHWCLKLWARFIKLRDGNRCVICGSRETCSAHHIFRKTRMPAFRFLPGNGITLCREHHAFIHSEFNGPPLPNEKLNERGGEDPNEIAAMFGFLADDAEDRGLPADEFYYVSNQFLNYLKALQGLPMDLDLSNRPRIKQAEIIFSTPPPSWIQVLAELAARELITGERIEDGLRALEMKHRRENVH